MGKITERATNPNQYDMDDMNWIQHNGTTLNEKLFYCRIMEQIKSWEGKNVLEIGAGMGWLLDLAVKGGAKLAEGVEPSSKNVQTAQKLFLGIKIYNKPIEEFQTSNTYDLIISIMTFNHIKNPAEVFSKIKKMLKKDGKIIIIVPDYDYAKMPRLGYQSSVEEKNSEEYAVHTKRQFGAIADIVRKTSVYEKCAKEAGLNLSAEIPLCASKEAIELVPKYKEFENTIRERMLIFEKKAKN